jgi:Flp pilus assembly protein TadG
MRNRLIRMNKEKGMTLFIGILSMLFIIPMVGLAIDVGFLYVVKSKLQSAVDGASLAAARALVLGQTTTAQSTSAKNHAVNWFFANLPNSYFGVKNTAMDTSDTHVSVFDDASNPHLRHVKVTASTQVDTFFMKWFGFDATTVSAVGDATRRDVVVMLVLDRSFSIQMANSCGTMKSAAKVFTGQFSEGRDLIGLVSFSNDVLMQQAPTTTFQTALGYTNDAGSGTGLIDNIVCQGNTNTAQAMSVAYNELWKKNLPGAYNVLVLETDGLPNTLTLNFWDSAGAVSGLSNSSSCKDKNGNTKSGGGFTPASTFSTLQWTTQVPLGTTSYLSGHPTTTPAGLVGVIGSTDPGDGLSDFVWMQQPYTGTMPSAPACNTGGCFQTSWATNGSTAANNCGFANASAGPSLGGSNNWTTTAPDFAWFPATDVYGNKLNPTTNPYLSVTNSGTHVANTDYTNFHNAAANAADNAAYQARVGVSLLAPNAGTLLSATVFVIGLGGTVGSPPDPILLQRMANDPNGDNFNSPAKYSACSAEPTCVNYSSQPQGMLVYSSAPADWSRGFLLISSQILRLSQ